MRQKRRVIYMTDPEWANLQFQAEVSGLSASAIIREAVRAVLNRANRQYATEHRPISKGS